MADVFISYSKEESDLTIALARDLERVGYTTWWDTSLLPGEEFQQRITEEINKARVVIVIWTAHSVKSKWVQAEAQLAASQNKLLTIRTADLQSEKIPLPFNMRHTDLLSDRTKLVRAISKFNLLPPFENEDELEQEGGGSSVAFPAESRLAQFLPFHRVQLSLSSAVADTAKRIKLTRGSVDKIYLGLGIILTGLCLGTIQLLGLSRTLNHLFVSILEFHPDGVKLEGRYLYPNYLVAFYIISIAVLLMAFAVLCAAYLRKSSAQAPSKELVALRQDVDDIIRYAENITNYIYDGDTEAGRFDTLDAHIRYYIKPNGDTEVNAVFEIHCTTDPAHFWKYWIEADPESTNVTSFRQLRFEVVDVETAQTLDWLPTHSSAKNKVFAIFFPELKPGSKKKLRICYFWPGYMKKLTDLGATSFDWGYRSQHPEIRSRVRQEWIFHPDEQFVRCRITGKQSKTATLQNLRQQKRSTWIYDDPSAVMDGSRYSVEFSALKTD
jgi:hypothetical protein